MIERKRDSNLMLCELQLGLVHVGHALCVFVPYLNGHLPGRIVGLFGLIGLLQFFLAGTETKDSLQYNRRIWTVRCV